jgi:hypothetical protein
MHSLDRIQQRTDLYQKVHLLSYSYLYKNSRPHKACDVFPILFSVVSLVVFSDIILFKCAIFIRQLIRL